MKLRFKPTFSLLSNQSFPPCLATYASQKEWGRQCLRSRDGSDHKGPCVSGYRGDAQFYEQIGSPCEKFFFFFNGKSYLFFTQIMPTAIHPALPQAPVAQLSTPVQEMRTV